MSAYAKEQDHLARIERLEQLVAMLQGENAVVAGAGESTVVWRPGVPSAGNVYATFPEVVAAVAKLNGDITIGLDTDTAPAIIPPGNYDLRPAGVSGPVTLVNASKNPPFNTPFAQIGPGAVTIKGLTGMDDAQFDNQSTVSVMAITLPGSFEMRGNAKIFQTGVGHFWDVTGGTYLLIMDDFSGVTDLGGGTALRAVAPAVVFLSLNDAAFVEPNMVTALAGALFIGLNEQARYGTQAGAVIAPAVRRQSGVAAIVPGTGQTAAIPVTLTAASRIIVSGKTLVTDANTKGYAALSGDRVNGAPGSFKITALLAGGAGGAVNGADASTEIDWEVINGP